MVSVMSNSSVACDSRLNGLDSWVSFILGFCTLSGVTSNLQAPVYGSRGCLAVIAPLRWRLVRQWQTLTADSGKLRSFILCEKKPECPKLVKGLLHRIENSPGKHALHSHFLKLYSGGVVFEFAKRLGRLLSVILYSFFWIEVSSNIIIIVNYRQLSLIWTSTIRNYVCGAHISVQCESHFSKFSLTLKWCTLLSIRMLFFIYCLISIWALSTNKSLFQNINGKNISSGQRRTFIFGALGYFKLGTLLEGWCDRSQIFQLHSCPKFLKPGPGPKSFQIWESGSSSYSWQPLMQLKFSNVFT